MKTGPYHLAEGVFACLSDDRFVFMDLRRNRYLCLNRRHSRAAAGNFGGFQDHDGGPPRDSDNTGRADCDATDAVLTALSNRGLLSSGDVNGKVALPVRARTVNRSLLSVGDPRDTDFRYGHLAAFVRASLAAAGKLCWQSMHRSVRGVSARRRKRGHLPAADGGELGELVAVFHHLRPLYGRKYHCLFDSLALLEFLARYRCFPHWVFAVRSAPFAAHCWVQHGDCVLNDTVENVRGYTPIMVA